MITQSKLLNAFDYRDGQLIWKIARPRGVKPGDVAGRINKINYVIVGFGGRKYLAHRLIFMWHHGYIPEYIDHIDRNPLNNKIENLREATNSQNQANISHNKRNTSGFLGVSWESRKNKWRAQLRVKGKSVHIGLFDKPEEAYLAYCKVKYQHFGEYGIHKGENFEQRVSST